MIHKRSKPRIGLGKTVLYALVWGVLLMLVLSAEAPAENGPTVSEADITAFSQNASGASAHSDSITSGTESGTLQPVWSLAAINNELAGTARMTIAGMLPQNYDSAMAIEWTPLNRSGAPQPFVVDLLEPIGYADIENILFNLDLYDGVDVLDIGDSEQGRDIYMVRINLTSENVSPADKPVILLTGSVHAREFAGADYLVKMMNDLMVKAQTDAYIRRLLEQVTLVCVPLVNPDGRELIMLGGDVSRKSNANGVDLNRNMPSLNAGILMNGAELSTSIADEPGMDFFPGDHLGSESESQAMIRFFNAFVPDSRTKLYVDLHQRGQFMYYNKPFLSPRMNARSRAFASALSARLGGGYPPQREALHYGISGLGGTMTDYARSIAEGMTYSYKYGRLVLMMDGIETPLGRFSGADSAIKACRPANPGFIAVTPEIGTEYSIGPGMDARLQRAQIYSAYNWDSFLPSVIELVLGDRTIRQLKEQAG